jgi:hypothetical protein
MNLRLFHVFVTTPPMFLLTRFSKSEGAEASSEEETRRGLLNVTPAIQVKVLGSKDIGLLLVGDDRFKERDDSGGLSLDQ